MKIDSFLQGRSCQHREFCGQVNRHNGWTDIFVWIFDCICDTEKSNQFPRPVENHSESSASALWNLNANRSCWGMRTCGLTVPAGARVLRNKMCAKVQLSSLFGVWSLRLLFSICYRELQVTSILRLLQRCIHRTATIPQNLGHNSSYNMFKSNEYQNCNRNVLIWPNLSKLDQTCPF